MAVDLDSYVSAATPSKLGLTRLAAGAASGAAFTTQPVVAIQDSLGNTVTGSSAVVTMMVSTGGTVVGTATATASSGVATFSTVGIGGTAGTSYTLTFSSSSLTSVAQSITPTAGTASKYLVTTSSSSPTAGSGVTITAQLADANGNAVPTAGQIVTWSESNGNGSFSSATSTTDATGIATVTLTTHTVAGTVATVTATTASSSYTGTTANITTVVGAASLTQSTISASPSSITANGTSISTITVQLKDPNGNNLTASGGVVVLSPTLGTLGSVSDNSNGTYTATLTSATTAGTSTVSGTLGGSALTGTATVNFVAGTATQLVLTTQPVGAASGAAFARQPVVKIQDAFGNTVTSDNSSTVTMTVSSGATVVGAATALASSGVATFTTVGITGTLGTTYTLTFSSGSVASVSQTITPALLVSGLARNGNDQGKIIANGNVQSGLGIVFTTGPSSYWDLSGIDLFIAAGSTASPQVFSGGTIRFNLYQVSGGDPTIASSLTWVASSSATLASFNGVGAIQNFNLSTLNNLIPNTQYLLGIDVTGSVGTGSSSDDFLKIHAVTATPSSTLGWSANAVNSYNLTGVFGSGTSVMGSAYSTLGAGLILYGAPVNSASKLGLTTSASGAASGSAFTTQPVVAIQDVNGNTVTSSSAAVTMTVSSDGSIVGTASTTAVNGVATFSGVGIRGEAGTPYTLTFGSSGLTSATQLITPTAGSASQLAITTQPLGGASGAALVTQPVVVIRDAYGNLVSTDSSTVVTAAILSGTGGTLGSVVTKTAVSGVATFSGVNLSGLVGQNYVLQFTASTLTSANSGNVTVSSGPATTIAVNGGTGQSATVGTAVATAPSVKVTDAQGNAVSGASVTFAVATGSGTLGSSGVVTTDSAGIATSPAWTVSTTAGANTLTATSGSLSGSLVTFTATGTAGAATQLAITTQPVGGASGAALATQPVVQIRDQYGNLVTPDSSTVVTVAISSGTGGTLGVTSSGSLTATASAGVATFSGVSLSGTVGQNYVLQFTSSPTLTVANSGNVTVSSGAATQIAVNGGNNQSATVATSVAIAPSVKVTDAQGNAVSGVSVTFAVASGSGSLASTGVVTTDSTGVATSPTWTLGTIAGANTLTATSAGLAGSPLTISATGTAGAATQLAFVTQPSSVVAGVTMNPSVTVEVRDQFGNRVTTATDSVALVLDNNTSGGALTGGSSVNAVAGVATFAGLSINKAGTGYTLVAVSGTLTGGTSSAFSVTVGAADARISTLTPAMVLLPGDGQSTQLLTVTAKDALGNNLGIGGSTVVIRLKSGVGQIGPVTDRGDGTYTALLTAPSSAGVGIVVATLGGADVKNGGTSQTEVALTFNDVTAPLIAGPGGLTGLSSVQTVSENNTSVHAFTANEAVTWSLVGGRDAAKFTLSNLGILSFINAPDFETPIDDNRDNVYEVVIGATDGSANVSQQSLAVTVINVNESPDGLVLTGSSVAENAGPNAVVGTLQGSDPDRNTVFQYRLVPGVADNASFNVNGSALRASQSLDFESKQTHRLSIEVSDGGLVTVREVVVTVLDQNDAPVLAASVPGKTLSLQQAASWSLAAGTFTDVDAGQSLTYSASGLPPGVVFQPQTLTFSGTPSTLGTYTVQVTATDSGVSPLSAISTFEVAVVRQSLQLSLNATYFLILNEDVGGALATSASQPVSLVFGDGTTLPVDQLGNQNLIGRMVLTGPAVDSQGNSKGTLSIQNQGVRTVVSPSLNNPVTVSLQDFVSGQVLFVPAADEYAFRYATLPYRVDLLSTDGNTVLHTASGSIYIAVRNVNDTPEVLTVPVISLAQNQSMTLSLVGLFADRDPDEVARLSYSVDSVGVGLNASTVDKELRITALSAVASTAEIQVTATDPQGAQVQTTLPVQLRGSLVQPNGTPTLVIWAADESNPDGSLPAEVVDGTVSIVLPENRTVAFAARGSDPDSDPMSYRLVGRDAALFAMTSSGRVSARKAFDFENPTDAALAGRYQLAVVVVDGRGGEAIQPVNVLVSNVVEPAELRLGRDLNWTITADERGGSGVFSINEYFVNPEGGSVSASIGNPDKLSAKGIVAGVQGDSVQVNVPPGFVSAVDMKLLLQANGLVREMFVRITVDFDSDGVDNFTEAFAGDRNRDGINDAQQNAVASLPVLNSDPGDPETYLSITATGQDNPYVAALDKTASDGGQLSATVKISSVEVGAVSADDRQAVKAVLGGSEVDELRTDLGLLGFSLEPTVEVKGSVSASEQATFESTVRAEFAAKQNVVRFLLPVGSRVNTFVKSASDGTRYEFLKTVLTTSLGVPRRDAAGNVLYTGAEFVNTDADSEFDEVVVYFVDNERGDEDPKEGSIFDPGILAYVTRDATISAPVVNALQSPTAELQPQISGTAVAGTTVNVYDGLNLLGTTQANDQGVWTFTPPAPLSVSEHVFTAVASNSSGVSSLPSNGVNLVIQNRVIANADSLVRIPRQPLKWKVQQILANDFVVEGSAALVRVDPLTTQGGSVRLDGGWIIYTPPLGLADSVVDSFGYEMGNGKETSRGRVNLVAREWTTGVAQNLVRVLPLARGVQLRFAAVPGRTYRIMGRSSLDSSVPWTDLGEATADEAGRLDLLDPETNSQVRFYRLLGTIQ